MEGAMAEITSQRMVAIYCRGIIQEQLAAMLCEHKWKRDPVFGFSCDHCNYPTGTSGDLYAQVEKEFEHAALNKRLKKFRDMIHKSAQFRRQTGKMSKKGKK
jgi:hypothetical protein